MVKGPNFAWCSWKGLQSIFTVTQIVYKWRWLCSGVAVVAQNMLFSCLYVTDFVLCPFLSGSSYYLPLLHPLCILMASEWLSTYFIGRGSQLVPEDHGWYSAIQASSCWRCSPCATWIEWCEREPSLFFIYTHCVVGQNWGQENQLNLNLNFMSACYIPKPSSWVSVFL